MKGGLDASAKKVGDMIGNEKEGNGKRGFAFEAYNF